MQFYFPSLAVNACYNYKLHIMYVCMYVHSLAISVVIVCIMQVNSIGTLTFDAPLLVPEPQPFPGVARVIAPYWSPVDLSQGGQVYYRTSSQETLLQRAQDDILSQFPDLEGLFEPTLLLVVTWFEVQEVEGDRNEVSSLLQ